MARAGDPHLRITGTATRSSACRTFSLSEARLDERQGAGASTPANVPKSREADRRRHSAGPNLLDFSEELGADEDLGSPASLAVPGHLGGKSPPAADGAGHVSDGLVFLLLLLLSFAVILLMTRQTRRTTIEGRIANLHNRRKRVALPARNRRHCKYNRLSQFIWLDQVLQRWPLAHHLRLLIAQAESSWRWRNAERHGAAGRPGLWHRILQLPSAYCPSVALVAAARPICCCATGGRSG